MVSAYITGVPIYVWRGCLCPSLGLDMVRWGCALLGLDKVKDPAESISRHPIGCHNVSWSSHLSHHIQNIVPSYISYSPYDILSQQPGSQGVLVLGHGYCRVSYLYVPLYVQCVYIILFVPKFAILPSGFAECVW